MTSQAPDEKEFHLSLSAHINNILSLPTSPLYFFLLKMKVNFTQKCNFAETGIPLVFELRFRGRVLLSYYLSS